MAKDKIIDVKVYVDNDDNFEKVISVQAGSTLGEIAEKAFKSDKWNYVAATIKGRLRELPARINNDAEITFISIGSTIGFDLYKRSLVFIVLKAMYDYLGDEKSNMIRVMYSLGPGFFCKVMNDDVKLTEEDVVKVKERIDKIIADDVKFEKRVALAQEAEADFAARGYEDKAKLMKYRRSSRINLYEIDGFTDYFYGYMVPSAGYIKEYDIKLYADGFVIAIADKRTMTIHTEYKAPPKLYNLLRQSEDWGAHMNINCVGDLNDIIVKGGSNGIILLQEALMEKQIGDIARTIKDENKKLILIAGPSSSGKTTFSNRLSVQLATIGIRPHPIAMDDFFKNREDTPRDENGKYDFECIEAMDMELFSNTMNRLLKGEEVDMPTFDFTEGCKKYTGRKLKLGEDDILVVEGIHALNPITSQSISADNSYKIYISCLTQLNLDEHNRISTTDTRLLRRIVRDARTRGNDAQKTISMWPSVRKGENENIFPYQEEADVMFNSAMLYELPALKIYAEPLLYSVPRDTTEYYEAKRLLKFLDYFLGIDMTSVPMNSLIREFAGGGCFRV